ncbi:WhiB family transcriptional regulator [Streptomyces sp. Wb2n-11]|uniref:WhiB family transcriptional regulator n=1 Tax=Streptomyces sp. Wb2n-11 TaxID=1030533 RepID=UPI000A9B9A03
MTTAHAPVETARSTATGRATTKAAQSTRTALPEPAVSGWWNLAACREVDPELFFPANCNDLARNAKKVCGGCPVQLECLQWALDARQDFGVWGGLTERERRQLHRRKPRMYNTSILSAVDHILAYRLDEFRAAQARGLTSGQMARELGTNVQTISKVAAALKGAEALDAAAEAVDSA